MPGTAATNMLAHEVHSLLGRLETSQPFALHMPMVAAASPAMRTLASLEHHVMDGRRRLEQEAHAFLGWLHSRAGRSAPADEAQHRMSRVKMHFQTLLTHFDMFADVLTQRSEHKIGLWLAGLDRAAKDMLRIPQRFYTVPPLICYLDRGRGAAIRRVDTRLPGGGRNPVAIVRIPRGRMISTGLAASMAHEVGHQASVFLHWPAALGSAVCQRFGHHRGHIDPWPYYERWTSEILADYWAVGRVGVSHALGLIALLALPMPFVLRGGLRRPHPIPWFRVKLSCAIGHALHPHPQWGRVARTWERLYPRSRMPESRRRPIEALEDALPDYLSILLNLRPDAMGGMSLHELMASPARHPDRLARLFRQWTRGGNRPEQLRPTTAFAVIGQARVDGRISPQREIALLSNLLTYWALNHRLHTQETSLRPGAHSRRRRPLALRDHLLEYAQPQSQGHGRFPIGTDQ